MLELLKSRRRDWLKSIGCFSTLAAPVRSSAAERNQRGGKRLPPSVQALTSMREQGKPITADERRLRVAKAQQLMMELKMDALLLAGGTSLLYFTGVHWGNSERLFACVLPARGKAFCVAPSFEEGRVREQLNRSSLEDAQVLTWQEDEDPYKLLAKGMQAIGYSTGTLGIEERTPWVFSDEVGRAAPQLRLTSATPVTAACRMLKSPHELELMRLANQATLRVYKAVFEALQPGMSQQDAVDLIDAAYSRVGFQGEASVEVGAYSALPHGSATSQIVRENTIVMIDDGCLVDGYNSDITRTFVLGKASDKMKRVFDTVKLAQSAALRTARPGVECQTVDAAARKVVVEAGYGPDYRYFSHRVGHGIGMDGHEWPYLVRGNTLPLQASMTFSDEPGIYIPNEFGMRLEDDMYVTSDGAELFTSQSPSLEHPFG